MSLGCEVLSRRPSSPDLTPKDFHLLQSLGNFVSGRILRNSRKQSFENLFFGKIQTSRNVESTTLFENEGHYIF